MGCCLKIALGELPPAARFLQVPLFETRHDLTRIPRDPRAERGWAMEDGKQNRKSLRAEEPVVISAPQLLLCASYLFGAASRVLLQSKTCTNRFSAHREETSS